MNGTNKVICGACLAAGLGWIICVIYPQWSETRAPQTLEGSGFSATQFQKMSARAAGEFDRPTCGLYSLNLAEPKNYTQYEAFQLTAAAQVVAEIGAIQSGTCNCPYNRDMPVEAPQALLSAMDAPAAKASDATTRSKLRKLATRLQALRLQRCGA